MIVKGEVGPEVLQDGVQAALRMGRLGETIVGELHGRFYEQTSRGNLFSGGMGLTSINNATFTTGTLGVTATPIIGIYNPLTSGVNLVLLQAILGITLTALTNTGGGPYVWAFSTANGAISTGNTPWSRKTLTKLGSQAKDMSGVALTGMTNNLVVAHASALYGGSEFSVSEVDTAAGFMVGQQSSVENLDGSIIIPPGGVAALLATTTPVAHSAVAGLIWEEVAV